MKKLLTLLTFALLVIGINHAPGLAEIQAVDAQSGTVHRNEAAHRLEGVAQRVVGDHQRSVGSTGRAEVTGPYEANPAFATYPTPSPYSLLPSKVSDDCQCGADCNCPHEMVCKNGDCKKNYVIFFSATWCAPCRTMYPRIEELRKAGYIVYVFDVDQYKQAAARYQVDKLPTTVVVDNRKEIDRFIGVVDKERITSIAKTKEEQEPPKPFDYDFR